MNGSGVVYRPWPVLKIWAAFMVLSALLLGSLAIFTLGAVCFAGLFLLWVREKGRLRSRVGRSRASSFVFGQQEADVLNGALLLLCFLWFVLNIVAVVLQSDRVQLALLSLAFAFPPMVAHLYYLQVERYLGRSRRSRLFIAFIYLFGAAGIGLGLLLLSGSFQAWVSAQIRFDWIILLLMSLLFSLFLLTSIFSAVSLSKVPKKEGFQKIRTERRRVNIALLIGMGIMFIVLFFVTTERFQGIALALGTLSRSLPLLFLFVNSYYENQFEFFDVFVKRATLFYLVLALLIGYFSLVPSGLERLDLDAWIIPWAYSLTILPLVMAVPWLYRRMEQLLDRVWLGRNFEAVDAVKYFLEGVQNATTRDSLIEQAEKRLGGIFQTTVQFCLSQKNLPADFEVEQEVSVPLSQNNAGKIRLGMRPNQTPFFAKDITLITALAEVFGYLLQNINLQTSKQEQEKREQRLILDASRSELKALRAQINPHFLFNALNAIASLTHRNPDRAEEMVEQLAEVFRYTLSQSEKEWVRLEDEIAFISSYLEVEKARFGERLRVRVDIEPPVGRIEIPALLVQTLVENAIKHGVSQVKGVAVLRIRGRENGEFVEIEVEDNGPGFEKDPREQQSEPKGSGYGVHNVRTRLEGYFGEDATLTLERTKEERTLARIRIRRSDVKAGSR